MQTIHKNQEPTHFSEWKNKHITSDVLKDFACCKLKPKDKWEKLNGTGTWNRLQNNLLVEQGYICCYCGSRISINIEIDHFVSKFLYPTVAFEYENLFASCPHPITDIFKKGDSLEKIMKKYDVSKDDIFLFVEKEEITREIVEEDKIVITSTGTKLLVISISEKIILLKKKKADREEIPNENSSIQESIAKKYRIENQQITFFVESAIEKRVDREIVKGDKIVITSEGKEEETFLVANISEKYIILEKLHKILREGSTQESIAKKYNVQNKQVMFLVEQTIPIQEAIMNSLFPSIDAKLIINTGRHCNNLKGNLEIDSFNLLDEKLENFFEYDKNGKMLVVGENLELKNEIENVLGLNVAELCKIRREIYQEYHNIIYSKSDEEVEEEDELYSNKQNGEYAPYNFVYKYLIKARLGKL